MTPSLPRLTDPATVVHWQSRPYKGLLTISESWTALTGQPLEQARGDGWHCRLHPEDRDRLIGAEHRARKRHAPLDVPVRVRTAAGAYVPMRALAALMPGLGSRMLQGVLLPDTGAADDAPRVDAPTLVPLRTAAARLGLSAGTLQRWAKATPGTWAFRFGRDWRVDIAALMRERGRR